MWFVLLRGISPPVAVVEIDKHLHAQRLGAARHLDGACLVGVATAALPLARVIPNAETHPVHAVVLQHLQAVHLLAVHIVELRAVLLHLRDHRDIAALDEVRWHPRHRIHLHGCLSRRLPGSKRTRDHRREDKTFEHSFLHDLHLIPPDVPTARPSNTTLYALL